MSRGLTTQEREELRRAYYARQRSARFGNLPAREAATFKGRLLASTSHAILDGARYGARFEMNALAVSLEGFCRALD